MQKLILSLSLILILFGCHKDFDNNLKCEDSKSFKLPQNIRDYFVFKQGTWWVYEDTTKGTYDSMWVGENNIEMSTESSKKKECSCLFGYCFERATTRINNLEYQLNSDNPKRKSSYADINIGVQFLGGSGVPKDEFITWAVSIECVDDKYPVALYSIEGNKLPEQKDLYGGTYVNDTFKYYTFKGSAWESETIINNKLEFRLIYVKNIGLFQYFKKAKNNNLVLKRWHIVQ